MDTELLGWCVFFLLHLKYLISFSSCVVSEKVNGALPLFLSRLGAFPFDLFKTFSLSLIFCSWNMRCHSVDAGVHLY